MLAVTSLALFALCAAPQADRVSLPTEEDGAPWSQPGLRVALAVDGGLLRGRGPAAPLTSYGFHLRPSLRLDRQWSLGFDLNFELERSPSIGGTRYAALVEPMFHPVPQLGLGLGLGYGLLALFPTTPPASTSSAEVSRTLPAGEHLDSCDGSGWVGQARAEYLFVVGPLFATGPFVQSTVQWTGCESYSGFNTETGLPSQLRQWWLHAGASLGWWLTWR